MSRIQALAASTNRQGQAAGHAGNEAPADLGALPQIIKDTMLHCMLLEKASQEARDNAADLSGKGREWARDVLSSSKFFSSTPNAFDDELFNAIVDELVEYGLLDTIEQWIADTPAVQPADPHKIARKFFPSAPWDRKVGKNVYQNKERSGLILWLLKVKVRANDGTKNTREIQFVNEKGESVELDRAIKHYLEMMPGDKETEVLSTKTLAAAKTINLVSEKREDDTTIEETEEERPTQDPVQEALDAMEKYVVRSQEIVNPCVETMDVQEFEDFVESVSLLTGLHRKRQAELEAAGKAAIAKGVRTQFVEDVEENFATKCAAARELFLACNEQKVEPYAMAYQAYQKA